MYSDDYELLFNINEEIIDDIMYLQDIFSLKIAKINYVLNNCLFYYTILPFLCGTFLTNKSNSNTNSNTNNTNNQLITINTSIYVLTLLFYYINDESFLNKLYLVVFNKEISFRLKSYIEILPAEPSNYSFNWVDQKIINNSLDYASCKY